MTDLPYQAEYAKSGRAACKGCKQKIEQGELRIAVMVQSAFHDGKQPNWHHEECFFKKQRPVSVADINGYNKLKVNDQKRVKSTIENSTGIVMPVPEKGKGKAKGKGTKRGADPDLSAIRDFAVEYSKSSRATCRHCDIKICKGEVRISKTVYDTEVGMKYGGQPLWHHVKCFAEVRNDLLFMAGGENLPGFKNLNKEDQKSVKDEIKPIQGADIPIKKLKAEPKDKDEIKKENEKAKLMEKQNKLFHKYRNALSDFTKGSLEDLLEYNSQAVPGGRDECLDLLADIMAFGVLAVCPDCKNGQLVLDNFHYKCTGDLSEWSKCQYKTQNPKRTAMKIPQSAKDEQCFKGYKPKVGVREFETPPPAPVIIKKEEAMVKKEMPIPPLKNLQFFIYGKLKSSKEDVKHRVLKLGGLVVSRLTDTLAAVISTKRDVENMSNKMMDIQSQDVEVVEESYLDLIDPQKGTIIESLQLIKENNIADWGSDPFKRVPQDVADGKSIPKSGSMYVKSEKSTKMKIKGGTAIDPDSGLEDCAHVYKDSSGTKFTVVLSKTDVVAQKNSYYKLQLLESDNMKKYWVFRSWGRIGTTIGGNKLEECKNLEKAIKIFKDTYLDKTQNDWEFRDHFEKMPGCYYPIEVDYGNDSSESQVINLDSKCKLHEAVQKLIIKIFDVKVMKEALMEFELDTEKMPLGKLSRKQIKAGFNVLTELLKHIKAGGESKNRIIDATNRFYTLIPHSFGVENPPLLEDLDIINKKSEMLNNLLEIEIAYNLLKTEDHEELSPVEAHYLKLRAKIEPLSRTSSEYEMIQKYLTNTHAKTHSSYSLEIEEIFQVDREGESKRFKPFKKLHNRRLLWHGSRVTNYTGILSQGLRIAPPEAPVTGYMFGKGIYFADMVSKSANYCCTNNKKPVGCLLLCEVALGDMKECHSATNITKLPKGTHSVWGIGATMPDDAHNHQLQDGTIVPWGPPVTNPKASTKGALLYNEYIVYDVAQVNVKYLLQVKFNYK